jgi:hypothetical protein
MPGQDMLVVVDGKRSGTYDTVYLETMRFKPDGSKLAFGAWHKGEMIWVILDVK